VLQNEEWQQKLNNGATLTEKKLLWIRQIEFMTDKHFHRIIPPWSSSWISLFTNKISFVDGVISPQTGSSYINFGYKDSTSQEALNG